MGITIECNKECIILHDEMQHLSTPELSSSFSVGICKCQVVHSIFMIRGGYCSAASDKGTLDKSLTKLPIAKGLPTVIADVWQQLPLCRRRNIYLEHMRYLTMFLLCLTKMVT